MDEHRHENRLLAPSGSYHGTVGVLVWLPGSLGVRHGDIPGQYFGVRETSE